MDESEILLEVESPVAPVQAIVESDGDTVYLYRMLDSRDGERNLSALWLRNLVPAPPSLQPEQMKRGRAPILPARFVKTQGQGLAPDPRTLRVMWTLDGVGLFLFDRDGMLAAMPAWASSDMAGYSADCAQACPYAWPLSPAREVLEREVRNAEAFWGTWAKDPEVEWQRRQSELLSAYQQRLGAPERLLSASEEDFPPRVVAVFRTAEATILATLGMSTLVQPGCAQDEKGPQRVELALALPRNAEAEFVELAARHLAAHCRLPWIRATFLGPGHTLGTDLFAATPDQEKQAYLFSPSRTGMAPLELPDDHGAKTRLLWLVPITREQRERAQREGSQKLLAELA